MWRIIRSSTKLFRVTFFKAPVLRPGERPAKIPEPLRSTGSALFRQISSPAFRSRGATGRCWPLQAFSPLRYEFPGKPDLMTNTRIQVLSPNMLISSPAEAAACAANYRARNASSPRSPRPGDQARASPGRLFLLRHLMRSRTLSRRVQFFWVMKVSAPIRTNSPTSARTSANSPTSSRTEFNST
jgi:hypothetical protein